VKEVCYTSGEKSQNDKPAGMVNIVGREQVDTVAQQLTSDYIYHSEEGVAKMRPPAQRLNWPYP